MDRALFDAVQQRLTDQWTTRSTVRNASDHLLIGFLFDDAGQTGSGRLSMMASTSRFATDASTMPLSIMDGPPRVPLVRPVR
jgi:hypothetical protein